MIPLRQNFPLTVLVVDDDYCTRNLLAIILEKNGYKIINAEDGLEALEVFERQTPDVIITDINMPRMNGLDLIKRVRKSGGAPAEMPIIALTADIDMIGEAQLAGADIVGRKPTDMRKVPCYIQELFEAKSWSRMESLATKVG